MLMVSRVAVPMTVLALAMMGGLLIWLSIAQVPMGAVWSSADFDVQMVQRDLHQQLGQAVTDLSEHGVKAAVLLIGLSFAYGMFHAAGPGHGKVVISTYLLTHESQLKRGLALSLAASLVQGLSAVLLVVTAIGVLGFTMRQASEAVPTLEAASYALIALMGAALTLLAVRRVVARVSPKATEHASAHHMHDDHGCCGHSHGPSAAELRREGSWRETLALVLSIGIRPCSGAVLVLVLAYAVAAPMVGIAAVFAMSLGTAITVSGLALLSVYARSLAGRIGALLPDHSRSIAMVSDMVTVTGGILIFLFGVLLLNAALTVPAHPFR